MTDTTPAAQSRAPKAIAAIGAAVLGVLAFTSHHEGTVYRAYRDPAGIWTICTGHTAGVKAGDVATAAQCSAYLQADMAAAMKQAIAVTPALVDHRGALMAAGDLVFNGGIGAYRGSAIAVQFSRSNWAAGCNAFPGWWAASTFKAPQPQYQCRPKKGGGYLCNLPGLVKRRLDERALCLAA